MKAPLFLLLVLFLDLVSAPHYYVTGANFKFFKHVIDLVGSLHKVSFDEIEEIAIFDLGLTPTQIYILSHIQKVKIYWLENQNPDLLKDFYTPNSLRSYLGWYAWKPAAMKQMLKKFPYFLWIDAGCEIDSSCAPLFDHILGKGYFLVYSSPQNTTFDTVRVHATKKVRNHFQLDENKNLSILDKVHVMAGFIGIRADMDSLFLNTWNDLTANISMFEDDGTSEGGWGCCRHDQSLLSIIAHQRELEVFKFEEPIPLQDLNGSFRPFSFSNKRKSLLHPVDVRIQQAAFNLKESIPYIRFHDQKARKKLFSRFYKKVDTPF